MLSDIVKEWYICSHVLLIGNLSNSCVPTLSSQLRILLFNVRGLDRRWEEVLLILDKYKIERLILTEVGSFEFSLINQTFIYFRYFYQKGENKGEGVLMLFKSNLAVVRIKCETPNVCVVDVKLEQLTRLIGVYAPKSSWTTLTNYISDSCCVFGDFSIDIDSKENEMANLSGRNQVP